MTQTVIIEHVAANDRDHFALLLRRYPTLDAQETEALLDFLAKGPIIEVGHLAGDPELKPIVERVKRDHPKRFSVGVGGNLLVAMILVVPLLLFCWWAWDSGAK
jgi:hypothetical protein